MFSGLVSSFVILPGAADIDAGEKIDSHHTSDVLSKHITVTQTSPTLLTSAHSLNVRADESESLCLLAVKKKQSVAEGLSFNQFILNTLQCFFYFFTFVHSLSN